MTVIRRLIAGVAGAAIAVSSVAADATRRVAKKRSAKSIPVYNAPVARPIFRLPAPPMPPPPPLLPLPPLVNPPGSPPTPLNSPAEWFPEGSYPVDAKRDGQTGRVTVRLTVDRQGRPYQCKVARSSGWPVLDATTCYLAQSNARFTPARGFDAQPIEWTYQLSTRWELQDDEEVAPPPPPPTASRRIPKAGRSKRR